MLASRPAKTTVLPARSTASPGSPARSPTAFGSTLAALRLLGRLFGGGGFAAPAGCRRLLLLGTGEALLQRIHQVDHLAGLGRAADDRLFALHLGANDLQQRLLIAVGEGARIEGTGLLLDQHAGKVEHFLLDLGLADLAEVLPLAAHF